MNNAIYSTQRASLVKLVDTTDLKSVPFWSASSSLAGGTLNFKKISCGKIAEDKKQFVYDNVYDMTYCIRHEEKKGSSSARDLQNSRLKNYCYFFFYTHVLITIGNTHVFLKTQPMHLCDSLVYNRILAIVDTYMCIEQQRKCSQYVQHFREPKDPTPVATRGIS